MADRSSERGQATSLALLAVLAFTLVAALSVHRLASTATSSARAQTAADAAALAGAGAVADAITSTLLTTGRLELVADSGAAMRAAADYAERNGGRLAMFDLHGVTATAVVEIGGAETVSTATAVATVLVRPVPPPSPRPGGALPDMALDALAERAGAPLSPGSALQVNTGTCEGGVHVAGLEQRTGVAIVRAEALMGRPLRLTAAYRCPTDTRPDAVLHHRGLAFDTEDHARLAPFITDLGLCQPFSHSPDHFAVRDAPECGGRVGSLAPGEALNGTVAPIVAIDVRLVAATPAHSPAPHTGRIVAAAGIEVDASIADAITSLVRRAAADGLELGGSGYREAAAQVALRRAHCGPTEYDIYRRPAGECSPPTAQPGHSMHERGLAIDFTCDGRLIATRLDPCFEWLAAHAGSYGLYNLPSEPWHWSTTGH